MADVNIAAKKRLLEIEDENIDNIEVSYTSRKRINSLAAVIRNALFKNHGKKINEKHMKSICTDLQPNELEVCLLIANCIMPYILEKKSWRALPYQMPLILMANEIFRSCGYSKLITILSPLTKPSQLNALKMNAPSFFSLFFSSKKDENLDVLTLIAM